MILYIDGITMSWFNEICVPCILENIWQPAINLCGKMKTQTRFQASGTIAEFQWRHLFGSKSSSSLFNILDHISSCYGKESIRTPLPMPKNEV